ncbi:MAG: carboxypeptidase regulatory-like domain-containing protein [Thermoanaerobaculia bacterium]
MRTRTFAAALAFALSSLPALAAITGSVMTVDGAPIASARVSIHAPELPDARRARLLSQSPERVPAESTQADAKGAFSLPSPKEAVVELRIDAVGYEPVSRRVERDEEAGAIALTKREGRKGVVTAGGKPVANATVVISYEGTDWIARTDEQGRYEAPDPKRARSITVLHPDFAVDEELFMRAGTPASELDRKLVAGTKVTGRVVAADGTTPVANATILLDPWPLATSGDDGMFTIPHAPAKWSTLTARKDALIARRAFDSAVKSPVTLKLEKAAVISGRVTDSKTKMPVAGAIVTLNSAGRFMIDGAGLSAITDAKGGYSIAGPAGAYAVSASHPAFELNTGEVTVTAGQQAVKDLTIGQLARVSGVVVDEEQKPVVAASVVAEPAGAGGPMPMPMRMLRAPTRTVTGPDGRFSVRVSADEDLRMRATKKGLPHATGDTLHLAPAERKTGVVLLIPTGIAVAGVVKDPNGDPLSGVSVVAMETPGGRTGMIMRQIVMAGFMGEEEDAVRTASDGTFTLRVKEGTYDFAFRREGYAPKAVRAQTVTAQGGTTIETTLEPAVEITGRVTRGGVGLADVRISSFGGSDASAVTGPDGAFTLGGLSPGSTRLMLRKDDDFIQDQRTVTAPARDVVFEFPAGGRVTGRVTEKGTRKPITTFQAGISTSRGGGGFVMMAPPQLKSFTSDDGSFTLENVPAGAMNIVAQAPGYAGGRVNVDVEEGKTVPDVVIELDTGVRLVGKVTGPNGAALPDAAVQLQPSPTGSFARTGSMRRATTDASGEFTLDSLDPGEETFSISHPKYLETTKTVTLKGREMRMDVQLSGGQRVTGVVVTDGGMPVADAEVQAFTASGMSSERARTNASGAFEFASLAAARYRFAASKAGYVEGVLEDVDVSSGGNLRIELRTGGTIFGRVIGLSEQELAGATVTARGGRTSSSAAVDPSGNFRIEGAPTGTVQVSASTMSRGFMERRSSGTLTLEVTAGSAQQVDLEFRGDTIVRGRITRNGIPLGGATVMFQPRGASRASASTTADEAGNYSASGLEEGEYMVLVADTQRWNPYQTTYHVRSGASTFDIDYKVASVRGRVVDAGTNEPIADAMVNFRPSGSAEMRVSRAAMTDPNGNFTMESVSSGTYVVTASREGYGAETKEEPFGESGRDGLEFRLSRNDGVTLRVVDGRDGRQITAMVTVYDAAGRVVYDTRSSGFPGLGTTTDMHLPLAPGSYTATLAMSGYAASTARLTSPSKQTVSMTPGGTIAVQSKHSVVRRMRLLDSSGMPYPRTSWTPASRELLPGTVPINNVAPGSYTLQLLNDDDSVADTQQVVVREGETTRGTL